jgi:hypothetical protein
MNKEVFILRGTVTSMGDLVHIPRKNIPDLYKRVLTIELPDGQKLFPEVRNQRLKILDREQIEQGCFVELGYTFEGSEKNGKRYNNIYVNSIKKFSYE